MFKHSPDFKIFLTKELSFGQSLHYLISFFIWNSAVLPSVKYLTEFVKISSILCIVQETTFLQTLLLKNNYFSEL